MSDFLPATADAEVNARLPQNYEAAKLALAECDRLDQCAEWANRAEAIASYARQARDETLETLARRIKLRASRRLGELLRAVDGRRKSEGTPMFASQREAAESVGLSLHQQRQVIRIAAVPEDEFEEEVEAEKPITLTDLAERGKRPRAREHVERLEVDHLAPSKRAMRAT